MLIVEATELHFQNRKVQVMILVAEDKLRRLFEAPVRYRLCPLVFHSHFLIPDCKLGYQDSIPC